MNNKRIGKIAVTVIVGMLSAISGIVSMEMAKSLKKEAERAGKNNVLYDRDNRRTKGF